MTNKLTPLATLVFVAAITLTACGGDETEQHQVHTASNGDKYNDADASFATNMIRHHAQALQMTALTAERDLDPQVTQLAEDIRMAQSPEVEEMVTWLTAWGEPVPETSLDHANAHGDGGGQTDSDMPGMMTQAQMDELEAAQGGDFERLFMQMMIEHHRGAIEMAETQQSEGHFGPAMGLAKRIEKSHQREIATLEEMLGS